jgi:hypothetical protein
MDITSNGCRDRLLNGGACEFVHAAPFHHLNEPAEIGSGYHPGGGPESAFTSVFCPICAARGYPVTTPKNERCGACNRRKFRALRGRWRRSVHAALDGSGMGLAGSLEASSDLATPGSEVQQSAGAFDNDPMRHRAGNHKRVARPHRNNALPAIFVEHDIDLTFDQDQQLVTIRMHLAAMGPGSWSCGPRQRGDQRPPDALVPSAPPARSPLRRQTERGSSKGRSRPNDA